MRNAEVVTCSRKCTFAIAPAGESHVSYMRTVEQQMNPVLTTTITTPDVPTAHTVSKVHSDMFFFPTV